MQRGRWFTAFAMATFFGLFAQAQTQFRDVPAGHWAQEAVAFAVRCGLIEGFPDGTFRGNQNLTRYQAALIFFRLYQTNRLQDAQPECRLAVERGAQEVAPEMEELRRRYQELERTQQDQAARLAALEAEVKRAIEVGQQAQALQERLSALEQQVQRLAQAPAPQAQPAPAVPADLQARIEALEQQVQRLAQAPQAPTAPQEVAALERRVAELEEQLRARPDAARVAALEEQVRTLQGQVSTLQNQVGALQNQVGELRQQAQPPAPTPSPQPEVRPVPPVQTPAVQNRNFYLGASASLGLVPQPSGGVFDSSNIAVGGVVGVREAFLGFGLRAGLEYNLGTQALGAEAYLTRHFSSGPLGLYLGVGARYLPALSNPIYGSAAVGLDVNPQGPVGLFLEANPRFEPGLNFGLGARAGLKLNF
ncbi:MAG: S-layer homology domain-containing protein [Meiothermus sp.]|uniref:S-layer homology domain-containing protein n=1 Tax=Meiothermus sp. TaxID=1955249 RepID=UPI00261F601C|nr:S-layer homology domain-containing protein [Meiothermus sp.]MCS7058793.1 S-layer homology domain-containing protein [Meiothermus sp.]